MVNGRLSKGVTSFAGEAALGTAAEVGKLDGKMKRIRELNRDVSAICRSRTPRKPDERG